MDAAIYSSGSCVYIKAFMYVLFDSGLTNLKELVIINRGQPARVALPALVENFTINKFFLETEFQTYFGFSIFNIFYFFNASCTL